MKFCSTCGANVSLCVPEGDNRERFVCTSCQTIHYQNPKIVAGSIPEWDEQILLCRRAIEPRYGLWTLPAGFMENGETTEQAAMRETWEEAGARIEITDLYSVFSIPRSTCCSAPNWWTVSTSPDTKAWSASCSARRRCPGTAWLFRW